MDLSGVMTDDERIRRKFRDFLLFFREMPTSEFFYRKLIRSNYRRGLYYLQIDLSQLGAQASDLRDLFVDNPAHFLPIFEDAAREIVEQIHPSIPRSHVYKDDFRAVDTDPDSLPESQGGDFDDSQMDLDLLSQTQSQTQDMDMDTSSMPSSSHEGGVSGQLRHLPACQLIFTWRSQRPLALRSLAARHVSQLVCVAGIITKASRTQTRITQGLAQCPQCRREVPFLLAPGHTFSLTVCNAILEGEGSGSRCLGRFVVVPDRCSYLDTQEFKLQELQEEVPTGEIPRNIAGRMERYLVESASPGTRVKVVGIVCTSRKASQGVVRSAYLRVLGVEIIQHQTQKFGSGIDSGGAGSGGSGSGGLESGALLQTAMAGSVLRPVVVYSDAEEEKYMMFARRNRDVYDQIAKSIDPGIFGHVDIKKAITCQLFSGTSRQFRDGTRRRGDIHILLLGDPSTAKSQLLKYTEKVAPISVYTSGKGSSAAGLTASVIREPSTMEFYLEGGSMVLADGGICCVDEFDKMNESDRVAIHEAMEQQTISIAKAGITTVLNSRTSVLAAANPVGGRYEDYRSPEEQIDFQTTILSRFDLIFIVRDVLDRRQDALLAQHVANLHVANPRPTSRRAGGGPGASGPLNIEFLSNYIAYCRRMCDPALSEDAISYLTNYYVAERQRAAARHARTVIPITVRQLEALMRLTEALARMHLRSDATREFAEEAVRLFKASTVQAIQSGEVGKDLLTGGANPQLDAIQNMIRNRVAVKSSARVEWLFGLLTRSKGVTRPDIQKALYVMCKRGEIDYRNKRKIVYRKK